MTNTAMLEKAIYDSGFRKNHIAKKMGITSYTLALKIKNEREFKANEIDALCELLNIDVPARMQIFFAK